MHDESLRCYHSDGYCQMADIIPRPLIEAARKRVQDMLDNQPAWAEQSWQLVDPAAYTNAAGDPLPAGIQRPALYEDVFAEIANHPNLKAAMIQILGAEVELFTDQIGVKHGCVTEEQGGCSFYHQDSYYWHIDPSLGVNCWIPFDLVDYNASALGIKPGSQRGWDLIDHEHYYDNPAAGRIDDGVFQPYERHRVPLDNIDFSDEKVFPMKPGDGLFFTNYTWHRSEPNRSGETKMFYAIAYQLTEAAIAQRMRTELAANA